MYLPSSSMATPVGVTFHVSWSTVMSTALSSMFLIIISSFLVVSPLKFCVTAVKLAASLCCPIRQLVTRARATHPRLSRGRPYRTCLPPGKSSADAKDETLTKSAKSNPTSPRDGWYRAPPLWWERYGRDYNTIARALLAPTTGSWDLGQISSTMESTQSSARSPSRLT